MIHFLCGNCKKALKAAVEAAGKNCKCNGCGEVMRVPGAEEPEPMKLEKIDEAEYEPDPLPLITQNVVLPPKRIEQHFSPAPLTPAESGETSFLGKLFYGLFVTTLIIGGAYCAVQWLNFASVAGLHARHFSGKDTVTIGESGYGIYHLIITIAEPLTCTVIWILFYLVGTMPRYKSKS